jgi:hypothetical protein
LYQIIEGKLATEGIQQFTFKYLQEGNYQPNTLTDTSWVVVDVRNLLDGRNVIPSSSDNILEDYEKKIDLVWETMQKHDRVVVCCVAGMSRSNAIAIGVLVKYFKMSFEEAWKLVYSKVPIANIHEVHVRNLKKLLGLTTFE